MLLGAKAPRSTSFTNADGAVAMFRRRVKVKRAVESIKRIPPGRQYYIGPARHTWVPYIRNTIFPPPPYTVHCTLLLVRITISCIVDFWVNYTLFARRRRILPMEIILPNTRRGGKKKNNHAIIVSHARVKRFSGNSYQIMFSII